MPEPILIEIPKRGRLPVVAKCCDAWAVTIEFEAFTSPIGQQEPYLTVNGPGSRYFKIPLLEDPVRAAELEERERCRRCVANEMDKATAAHDCPSAHKLGKALAAIDAPDEEVSEYERGRRDQYAMCVEATQGLKGTSVVAAIESVLIALRNTEPPR